MRRQQRFQNFAFFALTVASVSGCFQTPYSTTAAIRLPEGAGGAAVLTSAVEASGRVSGAFDPNASYAQALAASSGAIAGTAVVFPPGALSIAADIYVEHGSDLSSSSALADLGLTMSNSIAAAGAAAIIRPSTDAELKTPMSLSLPLPSGVALELRLTASLAVSSLLGLGDASERVAILAKVWDPVAKELRTVLIPRTEIQVENGLATFDTMYFGAFQTVVMENPVTEKVEAKASEPITNNTGIAVVATTGIVPQESIATTEALRPLTFASFTLSFSSAARTATAQARLSESVATTSCTLSARDKDRGTIVWSSSNGPNSASADQSISAPVTPGITGLIEASMSCVANDGRSAKSDWQNLARLCAAGKYGPDCVACAAGTYWDTNTASCVNAGLGYYANGDGVRRTCNAKPENSAFTSQTATSIDCAYICNANYYGTSCVACAAGTYWDTNTASCVNAGSGYYANGDGVRRTCNTKPENSVFTSQTATSTDCAYICNANYYGNSCVACAAGTVWDTNTASCVNAGLGYFANGDGVRRNCSAKPQNSVFTSQTATSIDCAYICNANYYGNSCVACAAGTYWDTNTASCVNAGLGYYANGDGVRRTCNAKPENSAFTSQTATSIDCAYICNANYYGTSCVACAAGTYWDTNTASCVNAGSGYYATGDGVRRTCNAKPENSAFTSQTATSIDCAYICNANYYGTSCVACAAGTWWNTPASSCAEAGLGYYANGDGLRYVCNNIPANAAFTNTRATSAYCDYNCATGYWGSACVTCAAGTYWSGNTCSNAGTGYYSTGNGVRQSCTNTLPAHASYSSTNATSSTCAWTCDSGYTVYGANCAGSPPTLSSDELQITTANGTTLSLTHKAAAEPTGASVTYMVYLSSDKPSYGSFQSVANVEAGRSLTTYQLPSGSANNSVNITGGSLTSGIYYVNVVAIASTGGRVAYRPAGVYLATPVVYLPFNGSNNDASSNANAFIPQPSTSTTPSGTDRFGVAYRAQSFDGSSQWGYTTNNLGISGTAARTLAYWVMPRSSSYNDAKIIAAWGSAGNLGLFGTFISGTSYTMWGWGTDYSASATMSGIYTWEHHVLTYGGGVWRFYKNGAQTSAVNTTLATINGPLTLGTGPVAAGTGDHSRYFAGYIDEVYVFNWPMGATEIEALYNVTRP